MSPFVAALLIFTLRCLDVSLGTLRLIFTLQGRRTLSAMIGFFEVTIFVSAIAGVVSGPLDPWRVLGYSLGFSAGTFLGMSIHRRVSLGHGLVTIISSRAEELKLGLVAGGFGVTVLEGHGGNGTEVGLLHCIVRRGQVERLLALTTQLDPQALSSVQEMRLRQGGFFTAVRPSPFPAALGANALLPLHGSRSSDG